MAKTKVDIRKDLNRILDLEVFVKSPGGRDLVRATKSDVVGAIDGIFSRVTDASHLELIALIMDARAKWYLWRQLTHGVAQDRIDALADLEEALKYDPDEPELEPEI